MNSLEKLNKTLEKINRSLENINEKLLGILNITELKDRDIYKLQNIVKVLELNKSYKSMNELKDIIKKL